MKKCTKCKKVKPLDEFYGRYYGTEKGTGNRKQAWCIPCCKAHVVIYRSQNMARFNANAKKWVKANTLHHKIILFRRVHRDMKDPHLTLENVKKKFGSNPRCYLTGVPIDLNNPTTYQLDHIIPKSRGGTSNLDNCGLASKAANQAKQAMTPDEFRTLCASVVENGKGSQMV